MAAQQNSPNGSACRWVGAPSGALWQPAKARSREFSRDRDRPIFQGNCSTGRAVVYRNRFASWVLAWVCGFCWAVAAGAESPETVVQAGTSVVEPSAESQQKLLPLGELEIGLAPDKALAEPDLSQLKAIWFSGGTAGTKTGSRGAEIRTRVLELGIDNLDAAARSLIALDDEGNALGNAMLAVGLAPDLPLAHIALARAYWNESDRGQALSEVVLALKSIPRNLEASAWLIGSLLFMIALVLIAGSTFFILSVGFGELGRAAHDLGDLISNRMPSFARCALLGSILLLPLLVGEGIGGITLAMFAVAFVYGSTRHRMALLLAVALLILGLYPVTQLAATVLRAFESDPVSVAVLASLQGTESDGQVELLESISGEEVLAEHALALRARRVSRIEEAMERYRVLVQARPDDAVILTNYGNLLFREGETEKAVELYERSAIQLDSARLMFNLSQAYARLFRIEEFESSLRAAQSLDADMVAYLSRMGDSNFVADLPFPIQQIRVRLLSAARKEAPPRVAIDWLLPGYLGESWVHMIGGFLLLAFSATLLAVRFDRASSCTRCGRRICSRCDETVWNAETCDSCHHLFDRPETTDPSMRITRLAELQSREVIRSRIAAFVSIVIPGAGGLLARRPDLGFLGILLFGLATACFVWREGVVPDPLAAGSVGSLVFIVTGSAAAFAYLIVLGTGLLIRRSH